jgi:hypothetical protein
MTSTRVWAIFALVGALIAVAGVAGYLTAFKERQGFGRTAAEILRRNGYLLIRPATQLNGPGSIVTIESKTENFVELHPTCKMDAVEVTALWQSSPSVDTEFANELSAEFELGATLRELVGLNVGGQAVREINVKFENTRVVVLTDEERFGLSDKYMKNNCLHAVAHIASLGKGCVTQTISAMQADVRYRIKFSKNVSASEKAKILGEVSGALIEDGHSDSSDTIVGKGLFVGLKLDAGCIVPNDGKHDSDADAKSIESLPTTINGTHYVKR